MKNYLIKPLKPYLANPDATELLVAPPYDIVSEQQARQILAKRPSAMLGITLPSSLGHNIQQTLEHFNTIKNQHFSEESMPCFILYKISSPWGVQIGLGCLADTEQLVKHEQTRPQKVQGRLTLSSHLDYQISPIMLNTDPSDQLSKILTQLANELSPFSQAHYHQELHQIYLISQPKQIITICNFLENCCIYIADGHHRSETQNTLFHRFPKKHSQYVLGVIFPGESLNILGYHRIIYPEVSLNELNFWVRVSEHFSVIKSDIPIIPDQSTTIGCYVANQWYRLEYNNSSSNLLAVDCLHDKIIEPIFKITDPRSDKRISFVGGENAITDIEQSVLNAKQEALAFTLSPTLIEDIINTTKQSKVMPPKSTYFEPKLLDGFLLQDEQKVLD